MDINEVHDHMTNKLASYKQVMVINGLELQVYDKAKNDNYFRMIIQKSYMHW